jgi:hypothetical protein
LSSRSAATTAGPGQVLTQHRLLVLALVSALTHAGAPAVFAQTTISPIDERIAREPQAGWSFTPGLDYAFVWDSNILFANTVSDNIVDERVHVVRPRGELAYVGRRSGLTLVYDGSLVQHLALGSLNSYDQRLTLHTTHQLSRRGSWFARYNAATSPTTELVELVGVPFARIGTRHHNVSTGLEMKLRRTTEASVSYRLQRVDFAQDLTLNDLLNGGYSHGGSFSLKHQWTRRLALTGNYDVDFARVVDGQEFTLQNSSGGVEYALSDAIRTFAAAGVSSLGGVTGDEARLGPALRLGLAANIAPTVVSVSYSRSYVPSYGFGGTSDNEELISRVHFPIARRAYGAAALALRADEPLAKDLKMRSTWFYGSVGYRLADWMQLEAFTSGTRQRIDRPGGRLNRYRVGLQLSTATTTRIR